MGSRAKVFRLNRKAPTFEIYESEPKTSPENEIVTDLYFPLYSPHGQAAGFNLSLASIVVLHLLNSFRHRDRSQKRRFCHPVHTRRTAW
jgi:hypothetical protein